MKDQRKSRLVLLLIGAVSTLFAVTASADDYDQLLRQALTRSDAGAVYVYDVLYEEAGAEAYIQIDPSREKGKRVTVISPPESSWDAEFAIMLNDLDDEADTQFWCSDFAENVPETATVIDETQSTVTYEYQPVPADDDDEMVMQHLTGRITVARNDPAIMSIQMFAPAPFSPIFLGRFDRFEFDVQCGRLPDGRSHMLRFTNLIQGKIATETINESAVWQILEYREVIE